ncbi:MAG TPA: extracellular solute-binding protein [Candidatus Eremiobacteraeota bacterium]|nr:MAG: sn-glycerol-3-phosphate-binding periplasmic protein UgpB precursor [bacterium ADurb.Bin363]HPZ07156.1 extracellular solute-binding protein [Candidatus Eremiobacteraeota bacterium]
MKYLIIILSLILIISIITTSYAQQGPKVIKFWYYLDDKGSQKFEELKARYNKEKAGEVLIESKKFASEDLLKEALLSGDTLPDTALIDIRWQSGLINKGVLIPLETHTTRIGTATKAAYKQDTYKPLFESAISGNHYWTFPYTCTDTALLVNLDILYSLKMDKSPQGWFDLVTAGKAMMTAGEGRMGLALPTDETPENFAAFFVAMMRQKGGTIVDASGKVFFNSEEGVSTLQFLQDLYHKYKVASLEVTPDKFFVGQVGMTFGDSHDYFRAQELGMNVEAVYLPKKDSRASDLYIQSLALFKTTPEHELICFDFLMWLITHQQMREFYLATSYIPVNKQIVACPQYFEYQNRHPGMRVFIKQLDWAKPVLNFPHYGEIMDCLGKEVLLCLKGEKTPRQALETVTNYGNSLLGF